MEFHPKSGGNNEPVYILLTIKTNQGANDLKPIYLSIGLLRHPHDC